MSDFLELARKVQARGMSVTEAVSKFKSALNRAGAPKKKARKKPIRIVNDGIRIYSSTHEVCLTKAAWQKRREEVWQRDGLRCQAILESYPAKLGHNQFFVNVRCQKVLELHQAEIHHIRKRSLGRNDHPSNLVTWCEDCHRNHHQSGKGK